MSIINDALRKVERDKKKSPPPENSSAHPLAGADVSPRGKGRFSLFSFFKGKNLVGIDMGASAIKCVRLSKRGGGYILAEFACERVSPGATGNEMSHALKTIVARQGLENACVASTIDAKSLSLSHITLPKMPAADLAEAVRWEVRKEIDFPDDAIIDFTVNDEIVEEGKKKLLIQTFAVEKEEVMAHVGMLKEASLRPYVVDYLRH